MTWGFTAQRRADEFDALVEASSTAAGQPAAASRDTDLLELVGALRGVPEIHARPEFVADLRAELMAAAETALAPADTSRLRLPERRPTRERRLAALVGGIAIVGATTSVAVASQSALPGDTLYPIKRAIEGAHTGLSVGEGDKGTTVLANASGRLAEVDKLAREGDSAAELRIAGTLSTFTEQATEASDLLLADYAHTGDEQSVTRLREFASSSLATLAALEPLVPADARDELIRAAQVLSGIDGEAAQRCPTCAATPIGLLPLGLTQALEPIFVPLAPQASVDPARQDGAKDGKKDGGKQGPRGNGGTELPTVPDDIGPGSVNPGSGPTNAPGSASDPIRDIVNGLTGGGGNASGGQPSLPVVGPVVESVAGTVGDILEAVLNPLTGQPVKDDSTDDSKGER